MSSPTSIHAPKFVNWVVMLQHTALRRKGFLFPSTPQCAHEIAPVYGADAKILEELPTYAVRHTYMAMTQQTLGWYNTDQMGSVTDAWHVTFKSHAQRKIRIGRFTRRVAESASGPAVIMQIITNSPCHTERLLNIVQDPAAPSLNLKRLHYALDQISR